MMTDTGINGPTVKVTLLAIDTLLQEHTPLKLEEMVENQESQEKCHLQQQHGEHQKKYQSSDFFEYEKYKKFVNL